MKKFFLLVSLSLILVACSSTNSPSNQIYIQGIVAKNSTSTNIKNFKVITPKNKVFSCTNITTRASCSTTFPEIAYKPSNIRLSWTENNHTYQKTLVLPKLRSNQKKLIAIVTIQSMGRFHIGAH